MNKKEAKASTFDLDGKTVEVIIVKVPKSGSLLTVKLPDGTKIVRHKDRLTPLNEEAKQLLK